MSDHENELLARIDERQKTLDSRISKIEQKLWWGIAIVVAAQLNDIIDLARSAGVGQ